MGGSVGMEYPLLVIIGGTLSLSPLSPLASLLAMFYLLFRLRHLCRYSEPLLPLGKTESRKLSGEVGHQYKSNELIRNNVK